MRIDVILQGTKECLSSHQSNIIPRVDDLVRIRDKKYHVNIVEIVMADISFGNEHVSKVVVYVS